MPTHQPETATSLSRRERNKRRIEERLYSSALALFAKQGYDKTTIDEIAEHADVARGTFFNYFQRKEDLISAWGERRRHMLEEAMSGSEPVEGMDAVSRLRRCMAILADMNVDERHVAVPMLNAWVKAGRPLSETPYVAQIFTDIIAAGQEEGSMSKGVSALHAGYILRDVYFGALYRWGGDAGAEGSPSLGKELQSALTLLFEGLSTGGRSAAATSP
ncbi:TetR/AcrR family transcriptional regulator [Streptomyces sp. LaPpAH-108]|uniref:TetR/AcrR family transcriptional regulator n=1 Tax=Streptomyces sp. LaPpAH-108 TaxID=1155714 RepID=UPI00035EF888|nr:TetR/AcrR family transcriptional regulator [Streptomyces sp. LaPpAH-108]